MKLLTLITKMIAGCHPHQHLDVDVFEDFER